MSTILKNDNNQGERVLLFETRSPEIQEVVGKMPSWIIRWGLTIITLFIIIISLLAFLVKYPDKVITKVTITTSNRPIILKAIKNYHFDTLLVPNNSYVKSNQPILVYGSSMDFNEIYALDSKVKKIQNVINIENVLNANFDTIYKLSGLQTIYDDFIISINNYKKLNRLSTKEKIDCQQVIIKNFQTLKNSIENWKLNNIISSPIDGQLVYLKPLCNNIYTVVDEELFAIKPNMDDFIRLTGKISASDYSKINVNQSVLISIEGFPISEYGYIKAKISSISNLCINNEYIINYELTNGLITTKHKSLPSINIYNGIGEIELNNKSVVDRMLIDMNVIQ